jgi:hypothetical protein
VHYSRWWCCISKDESIFFLQKFHHFWANIKIKTVGSANRKDANKIIIIFIDSNIRYVYSVHISYNTRILKGHISQGQDIK